MPSGKVYVAAALSQKALNYEIALMAERAGLNTFLPERDAPQPGTRETFGILCNAITACDAMVVNLNGIGNDTSWEVGFAYSMSKPIISVGIIGTQFFAGNNLMLEMSISENVALDQLESFFLKGRFGLPRREY